jgi:hypothetical protein
VREGVTYPIGKQQTMIKSRSTTTITIVLFDSAFAEQATRKDFTISDAPRERQTPPHTHTHPRETKIRMREKRARERERRDRRSVGR